MATLEYTIDFTKTLDTLTNEGIFGIACKQISSLIERIYDEAESGTTQIRFRCAQTSKNNCSCDIYVHKGSFYKEKYKIDMPGKYKVDLKINIFKLMLTMIPAIDHADYDSVFNVIK